MNLYLVQHGQAKTESEDPERPLNAEGAKAAEKTANWLSTAAVEITEIRHSGKKRAEQTAAIFAKLLSDPKGISAMPNLGPMDDVHSVAGTLENTQDSLMLVGHLPFMSRLAALLVCGDPDGEVVRFQNAGVVCLRESEGNWAVDWAVVPSIISG
jgi:phosphohistidine phosphatase